MLDRGQMGGAGGQMGGGYRWWGSRGQMGVGGQMGVISKHPPGTVWHETTLTSHQSGILHFLIFAEYSACFQQLMSEGLLNTSS